MRHGPIVILPVFRWLVMTEIPFRRDARCVGWLLGNLIKWRSGICWKGPRCYENRPAGGAQSMRYIDDNNPTPPPHATPGPAESKDNVAGRS